MSGRLEWWITTVSVSVLFQIAFVIALISTGEAPWLKWLLLVLAVLGMFACLWVGLAVTARRFRDRGDSPWMTLILAVPVLGELWVLVVCGFLPERGRVKKRLVVRKVTQGVADLPGDS